jgi:hypothetical protein
MHYRFVILTCLLACCLLATGALHAQPGDAPGLTPEEALTVVTRSGLVVKLPGHFRKFEAMQALLDTGQLNDVNRRVLAERLRTSRAEAMENNRMLIEAFGTFYDLGPVYFVYDTTSAAGLGRGIVSLNADLVPDPSARPYRGDFLLLRTGYTDASISTRTEALLLTDSAGRPLPKPFPRNLAFDNLGLLFNQLLFPADARQKRIERAVKGLDRQLEKAKEKIED